MATYKIQTINGLNQKINPLIKSDGELELAINVESYRYGAKKKRPGYVTYLDNPDSAPITNLFTWKQGTQFWNYRASGSQLFYSYMGTGNWTVCGNGTIGNGAYVSSAVLNDTMLICDGVGSTRHTTNGTSFTDTVLAPVGVWATEFQGRVYVLGTASFAFYSVSNDATNWNVSGTSDSSSIIIPGPGKLLNSFKVNNRLSIHKSDGAIFRWDGYRLVDMANDLGPSSSASIGNVEDYRFYLNRMGIFGYDGDQPEIVSNPIEKYIYNSDETGIAGTTFDNAPGVAHQYTYYTSVGSVRDDFTNYGVNNAITAYNYQFNEFTVHSFADKPTAFGTYTDINGVRRMIFGDATGQCYTYGGTALSDNGKPITVVLEGFTSLNSLSEKRFSWLMASFNPGCQAQMQIAISSNVEPTSLKWVNLGDASSGRIDYKFPEGSRGNYLFWRIIESSTSSRLDFNGIEIEAVEIPRT